MKRYDKNQDNYHEDNNTSVVGLKAVLDQKLKGHNQKSLLSLVPTMATPDLEATFITKLTEQGQ